MDLLRTTLDCGAVICSCWITTTSNNEEILTGNISSNPPPILMLMIEGMHAYYKKQA